MSEDRAGRILKFLKRFADVTAAESELYRHLTLDIIEDDYLLELLTEAPENQPSANMLFGAVHYLLLGGAEHELAAFYETVSGAQAPDGDPFGVFSDFCHQFRDEIVPLLSTRRVQTNEVRRAILLLPGFVEVARRSRRELATVEVGVSAGLLTLWDLYRYDSGTDTNASSSGGSSTFVAEVWVDNWFALYVNGDLIGEDSVPITTERSFNSETFEFDAEYPLTIAIEAKDFKENDSGLEYIGEGNQQMGDGGLIAQFTDTAIGEVVAVSNGSWSTLVIHRAPLNTDCESSADPTTDCQSEISDAPANWTAVDFDDSGWSTATVWSEGDVGPKDGYDEIEWDSSAELVWGTDLEVDNTVLLRTTVG